MKEKLKKFFKILEIEFQDLEEGLGAYLEAIEERYHKKEITPYVYKENDALLQREINDIRIIKKEVNNLAEKDYSDLEEAARNVTQLIDGFTEFPKVVHKYMKGKVGKVLEYVSILENQK